MKKNFFILVIFLFITFSICIIPNYIYAEEIVSNKVTLRYNANGGKGVPNTISVEKDTNVSVSTVTPKRNGYLFLGWSLTKTGRVSYQKGNTLKLEEDTVLYAIWGKKIRVTLNSNGGK